MYFFKVTMIVWLAPRDANSYLAAPWLSAVVIHRKSYESRLVSCMAPKTVVTVTQARGLQKCYIIIIVSLYTDVTPQRVHDVCEKLLKRVRLSMTIQQVIEFD